MDFFDRFIDRLLSSNQERRIRQIIVSAVLLMCLCVAGFGWMAVYELEYHIKGKVSLKEEGGIQVTVGEEFYDLVEEGMPVRFKELPNQKYRVVSKRISEKETPLIMVSPISADDPVFGPDGKDVTQAKIIYKKESLLKTLLSRR